MTNLCDEDGDGSISFKECCRASGKIYLLSVCVVFLILGGVQIVTAASAHITSPPGIGDTSIYLTYGTGTCVIVTCLVGFVGVLKMNKCWLGLFTVGMVILAVGMVIVSIIITSLISSTLASTSNNVVDNYLNCSYQGCCTECPGASAANDGDVDLEFCRKYSVPCDKDLANVNLNFCTTIEQSDVIKKCATTSSEFRLTLLTLLKYQFSNMVIVLLSSCGVIFISFLLAIYFTVSKKVNHVMDEFASHDESASHYVHKG